MSVETPLGSRDPSRAPVAPHRIYVLYARRIASQITGRSQLGEHRGTSAPLMSRSFRMRTRKELDERAATILRAAALFAEQQKKGSKPGSGSSRVRSSGLTRESFQKSLDPLKVSPRQDPEENETYDRSLHQQSSGARIKICVCGRRKCEQNASQ